MRIIVAAAFCAAALFSPVKASEWRVDADASSVVFEYIEGGAARQGQFTEIIAALQLDPAQIDESSAQITIDMTSLELGDALREGVLATDPWLNSVNHPTAAFALTSLMKIPDSGEGDYIASGILQIKGHEHAMEFPIRVELMDNQARASGSFAFSRRDYRLSDVVLESFVAIGETINLRFDIIAYPEG